MSERIHIVAQNVLGKSSVDECNVEEIESVVKAYPYFAPAHFLLLQKLKQEGSPDYNTQLQKAVLYYHNPLVFEHFIHSDKFFTDLKFEDEQDFRKEEITFNDNEQDEELNINEGAEIESGDHKILEDKVENDVLPEPSEVVEPENEEINSIKENNDFSAEEHLEVVENEDANNDAFVETEEPKEEIDELPAQDESPSNEDEQRDVSEVSLEESEISTHESEAPIVLPGLSSLDISKTPDESEIAFEPYHTVDYFASQGIKPVQDENPKDNFGKQLKSFTEWLKTMKKLPAADVTKTVEAEKQIETMANDSVHEPDVVTEAMADVWIKQGNKEKAIEIYNKLSLLNPSKKAFFASQVDNLKNT